MLFGARSPGHGRASGLLGNPRVPALQAMSGISVNEQCINIFNHIKTKSAVRSCTCRANLSGLRCREGFRGA
jgi:hypothetical protein